MPTFARRLARMTAESGWRRSAEAGIEASPTPALPTIATVYQPVVDLRTGQVVAVEALTRFLSSEQTPEHWFDRAAENGTCVELELAAIEAALRSLAELPENVRLNVNVSPETLQDGRIRPMLAPHAPRLTLEMTERARVQDFARLRAVIEPLRAAGARLATDDVGTGYANFEHISQLRPDILKLDQAMCRGIVDDHVCRAFVSALVGIGEEIGVRVTAEGIETPEQLAELLRLGVVYGQGYLLGRPDSPANARRLCERVREMLAAGSRYAEIPGGSRRPARSAGRAAF